MLNTSIGEHKIECTTCHPAEPIETSRNADCPQSGTKSGRIQRLTVEHLIKPELFGSISESQYYYCADADCPIVYFTQDSSGTFTKGDLQVALFDKDPGSEVNVCYCFDWTRGRITEEINSTGNSTAFDEISKELNADKCECESKNPKGVCCLGDINRFVKEVENA